MNLLARLKIVWKRSTDDFTKAQNLSFNGKMHSRSLREEKNLVENVHYEVFKQLAELYCCSLRFLVLF